MSALGSGGSVSFVRRVVHVGFWICCALALAYVAIFIYAYPYDHKQHLSNARVVEIQEKKITMSSVDGSDLPPTPDTDQANATIAGVDANGNGIRDDVELAIFAAHPTSSATSTMLRSAELQYAMDLQTLLTDVFDSNTWKAAIIQRERGFGCLYDSTNGKYETAEAEVENLILNTSSRVQQAEFIDQYRVFYTVPSGPDCDISRN